MGQNNFLFFPGKEAVMGLLSYEELKQLLPAEAFAFPSPIPTQSVSSDEFMPAPQTTKQREFEARIKSYGSELAHHQGMSRRAFFKTAAGMAAAFVAMNDTYGPIFGVSRAEAAIPEKASERAKNLSKQFIMDMHTHFLRDDTRIQNFLNQRKAVGQAGWNPALAQKEQTLDDLKFANYLKEIYFDSDTKVACISGSPSEVPQDCFLTNEMKAQARATINAIASHARSRFAAGGTAEDAWAHVEQTGRLAWVSDLAEIPAQFAVRNVYADVGQLFAQTTVAEPRLSAVMLGILIKGMGADHVCWGTDAIWTGAPQWQIEALRRLEIPEELQKKYGYKPLGPADGPVKNAIFGGNNARLYNFRPQQRAEIEHDKIAYHKEIYERVGEGRTNLTYGYIYKPTA